MVAIIFAQYTYGIFGWAPVDLGVSSSIFSWSLSCGIDWGYLGESPASWFRLANVKCLNHFISACKLHSLRILDLALSQIGLPDRASLENDALYCWYYSFWTCFISFQKNGCPFILVYYLWAVLCYSIVYLLANICSPEYFFTLPYGCLLLLVIIFF